MSDLGLVVMAAVVVAVDPRALALLPIGTGSSSVSAETGLALAIIAVLLVLSHLLISSWLNLRSAIRAIARHGVTP